MKGWDKKRKKKEGGEGGKKAVPLPTEGKGGGIHHHKPNLPISKGKKKREREYCNKLFFGKGGGGLHLLEYVKKKKRINP